MNSKYFDEAFFYLLVAEVQDQEQREIKRAQPPKTVYRVGRKGPTLHFRGRGRQGFQIASVSSGKT